MATKKTEPKFKIGDKVRVARRLEFGQPTPANRVGWTPSIASLLGKESVVRWICPDGVHFMLENGMFYYEGSLEPALYGNEEDP